MLAGFRAGLWGLLVAFAAAAAAWAGVGAYAGTVNATYGIEDGRAYQVGWGAHTRGQRVEVPSELSALLVPQEGRVAASLVDPAGRVDWGVRARQSGRACAAYAAGHERAPRLYREAVAMIAPRPLCRGERLPASLVRDAPWVEVNSAELALSPGVLVVAGDERIERQWVEKLAEIGWLVEASTVTAQGIWGALSSSSLLLIVVIYIGIIVGSGYVLVRVLQRARHEVEVHVASGARAWRYLVVACRQSLLWAAAGAVCGIGLLVWTDSWGDALISTYPRIWWAALIVSVVVGIVPLASLYRLTFSSMERRPRVG